MGKSNKSSFLANLFQDRFASTWKLLSETSRFLSRTAVFSLYEEDLRLWRRDLQRAGKVESEVKRIRQEIVELRSSLRFEGYDLSLARQNLILDGFRNDASIQEGFRRLVLFFGNDDIYWLSGDDNHITLSELLESQLFTRFKKRSDSIRSKHYLWYVRKGNDLILSGSDTERKEDFERLGAIVEANNLKILAKLKELK